MFYTCRQSMPDGPFTITKFDVDFNPAASYVISFNGRECSCPAGHRPMCRHRLMLPAFEKRGAINTGEFYNHDRETWHNPLTEETV